MTGMEFNPPPGWPKPPKGWKPSASWRPDPSWPAPPDGWQLWKNPDGAPQPSAEPIIVNREPGENPAATVDIPARLAMLEIENATLRKQIASSGSEVVELDDARVLQDVGIYRYHHPLETAAAYQAQLQDIETRIATLIKQGKAIAKSEMFTFNNSLSQGKKLSSDLGKLMLRAYNAEADNAIRSLRAGNVLTAKQRLEATKVAIAKLGKLMDMRIDDGFHALRIEEIELTSDWLMKKQEEREEKRRTGKVARRSPRAKRA